MPSFVKEARAFIGERTNLPSVELKYSRYVEGDGYINESACFNTKPIGDWVEIKFKHGSTSYADFLGNMIVNTTRTRRVMATIILEDILCENFDVNCTIRLMNAIKIIDPTFVPPIINKGSKWQREFIKELCLYTFPQVIMKCGHKKRIIALIDVLKSIVKEL
tara:strand:- start:10131 stop:10619 length:489 start_codon:yes stop_codon:yes gene_type:complete